MCCCYYLREKSVTGVDTKRGGGEVNENGRHFASASWAEVERVIKFYATTLITARSSHGSPVSLRRTGRLTMGKQIYLHTDSCNALINFAPGIWYHSFIHLQIVYT